MSLKLHVGCGLRKIHGFTNVDVLPSVCPDLIEDVFLLPSIATNSVDVLYSAHVMEHSKRSTFNAVFKRWLEVLKPGGILRLAVPDIQAAMKWYHQTGNLRDIQGLLWGGQRDDYDYHSIGWDEKTLTEDLTAVGFVNVHRYDWRQTEHFFVDDYSQATLPKLSYFSRRPGPPLEGMAVSLNVEANKP